MNVFITGASSGIGAALAREYARRGASVALAARRADRLEELAAEIRRAGRPALPIACDVTREGDLERAVERAAEALGPIDVAFANAGFGVVGRFEDLELDDYRRQFETNIFGVLRTVRAVLPELKRTRGTLAILGSVSGHVSVPGATPYSMSKFAVRALAEGLRGELEPFGVAVVLISPGFVESEFRRVDNRGLLHSEEPEAVPAWLVMPVDRAARRIASAVARKRPEAVITLHGKIAVFLRSHFPRLTSWLVRRMVRARPKFGDCP